MLSLIKPRAQIQTMKSLGKERRMEARITRTRIRAMGTIRTRIITSARTEKALLTWLPTQTQVTKTNAKMAGSEEISKIFTQTVLRRLNRP